MAADPVTVLPLQHRALHSLPVALCPRLSWMASTVATTRRLVPRGKQVEAVCLSSWSPPTGLPWPR